MRVLHVIPSVSERSGGPGLAIGPLGRALQDHGIEVTIATTGHQMRSSIRYTDDGAESSPAETAVLLNGIPTRFFPVQWNESFKYSRPLASWLMENVATFDVVHIHAVFNHACIAAARACRKCDVPYIVRPLGTLDPWSMKQKSLRKKVFWHAAARGMLKHAAAVHYTTANEQRAVEESLNLNHGVVIPLGVEIENDLSSRPADASSFVDPPYVLIISRLHPKKAVDVLLEAFLILHNRPEFDSWRLIVAGEGPPHYVSHLKEFVAAHHMEAFVDFPGWLSGEEKATALRNASLLALPSRQENFGLCVMESLAYGVPVLISPHVNLAPEIERAGAGWIAPVDPESLSNAMAEAMSSPDERQRRGTAGRELAQNFTWPTIAGKLSDFYESVLASHDRIPSCSNG